MIDSDLELMLKNEIENAIHHLSLMMQENKDLQNELDIIKQRNSQYRIENEKLRTRIADLEKKIEGLL